MSPDLANIAYLLAASLFVLGLKGLTHPRTAVRGNRLGALGMMIAVVVTLIDQQILGYQAIIGGVILGGLIGSVWAIKVPMTAMPQFVGMCNGFGGGASVLVAGAAFVEETMKKGNLDLQFSVATVASGLIGAVTFWGSIIAFGKLQGLVSEKAVRFPGDHFFKALLLVGSIVVGVMVILEPSAMDNYWVMVAIASVLGILLVVPIGGADMPVVVALLNSYSGLAAAATGFVLSNSVLIIAGTLVGASGFILTSIMCKAMNRSLGNVMFAGVGGDAPSEGPEVDDIYEGKVKSTTPEEVAMLLDSARRVVFVPGYGMAVAQAQHAVRELSNLLESNGVEVEFAIHPVAGRMPGHMNVLLAEADISYDKLKELGEANTSFDQTDITIVIGANDVVNPLARDGGDSPLSGMPILDVDKSKTVLVIKRSLSPGFAGIPNPLFAADNCLMLFADGKQAVQDLTAAVKEG
ncbi:MAG: NAD(P)(+) transhydrogenase (Re/Si-specific) subunit beta [Gemmatimonadota bacterium]|nr:NAD(P)(+) transhydrogenase (Re/Si-specific) subunit beta [Gemmatimonadota bacterium]